MLQPPLRNMRTRLVCFHIAQAGERAHNMEVDQYEAAILKLQVRRTAAAGRAERCHHMCTHSSTRGMCADQAGALPSVCAPEACLAACLADLYAVDTTCEPAPLPHRTRSLG